MASGIGRRTSTDQTPLVREEIFYIEIGGGAEAALGNRGVERFEQVVPVKWLANEVDRAHADGIF